jgi:hypothetical protein
MRHVYTFLTAGLLLLAARPVQAQTFGDAPESETITKVGTTAAQFLKLGVGARAIALGGAFAAEATDLSALYWNPSGLANLQGSAVQMAYTQYLADIDYNYAAFGTRLGNLGTLAASLIVLDSGWASFAVPSGSRFRIQNSSKLKMLLSLLRGLTW